MYEELPRFVKVFPSVSHSTSHTKTLSQRASGYIHNLLLLKCTKTHTYTVLFKTFAWLFLLYRMTPYLTAYRVWVALQGRVNLAQTEQLALLEETCFNPHGVQGRSSVTLREKKCINQHFLSILHWSDWKKKVKLCTTLKTWLSPWTWWSGHCYSSSGLQGGTSWCESKAQTGSLPRCSMMWGVCETEKTVRAVTHMAGMSTNTRMNVP